MLRILVEGWISYPHSYALVNIYQCIALSKISGIKLFLHELPPFRDEWQKMEDLSMLLTPDEVSLSKNISKWDQKSPIDVIFRIAYPYDISPTRGAHGDDLYKKVPLVIFYTAEFARLKDEHVTNGTADAFVKACFDKRILPLTPSQWSAQALRKHKFEPLIVPHGTDVGKYRPLPLETRNAFRKDYFIPEDAFVFLNVGAMTGNKNIRLIMKSFYKISMWRDDVYLILKGIGDLYACEAKILATLEQLIKDGSVNMKQWKKIQHRLVFIDDLFSYDEMCRLYNASDCYVSPYIAEGFNMPVLEAMACGLPVIVSKGGPTDDFTTDAFAKYLKTYPCKSADSEEHDMYLIVDEGSFQETMLSIMENPAFREKAKVLAPEHVRRNYTWDLVAERLYSFFKFITPDITPNMTNSCHSDLVCMP